MSKEKEIRIAKIYRHIGSENTAAIAFTQEAVDGFESVFNVRQFNQEILRLTNEEMKSLMIRDHEHVIEAVVFEHYTNRNSSSQKRDEQILYVPAGIAEYVLDQCETGYVLERIENWYPLSLFKENYRGALNVFKYGEMAQYMTGVCENGEITEPGRLEILDGIVGVHFDQLAIFVKAYYKYLDADFLMKNGFEV